MGDYFLADNFIENLDILTLINSINETVTFSNTVFIENELNTSNITCFTLDSSNIVCESLLSSNLYSASLESELITDDAANISNLSCYNITSSNLFSSNVSSHDINTEIIESYISATTMHYSSNIVSSNLLSTYGEISTLISDNILSLHEIYDRSNNVIFDSNSKSDWKYLKNLPESDEGLDVFNLAQSAFDLASLGYDLYNSLKSLVDDVPRIPDNIKDPLQDALSSNDNSNNNLYIDWSKMSSRPISTNSTNFDVGFKNNIFVSDLSQLYRIPTGNYSIDNTNLYNTKTNSNLIFDFTNLYANFNKFQTPFLSISSSNISVISSNNISIGPVLLSSNNLITSNANISSIINSNIYINNIYSFSNSSNPNNLNIYSTSNININTSSNGYFNLNSSNLIITKSNIRFLQYTSNANPFLDGVTTVLQINNSNIIIKCQSGSNSSTIIQDYNQLSLNMSFSNAVNNFNSKLVIDSNLNVFNVNSLTLKSDINTTAIYASQCNMSVNSNLFVKSNVVVSNDIVCSGVIRGNLIQLEVGGLPINNTYTPGIYSYNGKILLTEADVVDLSQMVPGTIKLNNTPIQTAWSSSYSKSLFNY
jgi:hypothetical protein